MPDSRVRVKKAPDALKTDHERIRRLFVEIEAWASLGRSGKADLFEEIRAELTVHSEIEEKVFYPAIASLGPAHEAKSRIREAYDEHRAVRILLDELSELDPAEERFDARMKELRTIVLRHAEAEEREVFPLFRKLGKQEQEEVSDDLQAAKLRIQDRDLGN